MSRRRMIEEPDNHERWLVSYADFITLLFAFFVVMYAISSVDVGKYKVLSETMNQAFDKPESTKPHQAIDVGELNATGHVIGDGGVDEGAIDLEIEAYPEPVENMPDVQEPDAKTLSASKQEIRDQLAEALSAFTDKSLVEIKTDGDLVIVEMKSKMLFPVASSNLSLDAIAALNITAKVLQSINNDIQVEGHTDNIPIRTRTYPSNWELSAARAASVVHYLSQEGVSPSRLAAIGYGEYRPIASNDNREGRQKNRRVSLVILSGSKNRGKY